MPLTKIVTDVLTQSDNATFETVRVAGVSALLSLIGLTGWAVIVNHDHLNLLEAGGGVSAILGGIGVGVAAKRRADAPPEA